MSTARFHKDLQLIIIHQLTFLVTTFKQVAILICLFAFKQQSVTPIIQNLFQVNSVFTLLMIFTQILKQVAALNFFRLEIAFIGITPINQILSFNSVFTVESFVKYCSEASHIISKPFQILRTNYLRFTDSCFYVAQKLGISFSVDLFKSFKDLICEWESVYMCWMRYFDALLQDFIILLFHLIVALKSFGALKPLISVMLLGDSNLRFGPVLNYLFEMHITHSFNL